VGAREGFAAVAIPILAAAIWWLPATVFLILLGAIVVKAADEMLAMARGAGVAVGRWLPLVLLAALLAAGWSRGIAGLGVASIVAVLALPTAQLAHHRAPDGGLAAAAVGTLVVLYIGCCGVCLGWLRTMPDDSTLGVRLLFFFLISIWIGDSGAYYVGSHFGRHKMSPRLSPNKTWEGLAGGVVATLAAAAAAKTIFGLPFPWSHTAVLAVILAVAAPVGDLVESMIKRDTRVKDSSTLIPGHGGAFDRTDSLLYAAPPVLGYLLAAGLIG
jgi:phosphatidate cytidylyltransferase